jgi:hypothetical protein
MPTETDVKLAADIADLRVQMERRFGEVERRFGAVGEQLAAIQAELGLIRKLGDRLFGTAIGIIGTMIIGAATVAWAAPAVVSDVRHQGGRIDKVETQVEANGKRLDKVETRLETMGKQLETLLERSAPKTP